MKEIGAGVWLVVLKDADGWRFGGWRMLRHAGDHVDPWEGVTDEERVERFGSEEDAWKLLRRDMGRSVSAARATMNQPIRATISGFSNSHVWGDQR